MMLASDIFNHRINMGAAVRESFVASLPIKNLCSIFRF